MRANKKLLGVMAVGLSAWLLVIALVVFNQSTKAMFQDDPVPSTNVMGASTTTLANSDTRAASIANEKKDNAWPLIAAIVGGAAFLAVLSALILLRHRKDQA